jgi:hypothetical protein
MGSEEFIRLQFEEYLLALLSAVKYHKYLYAVPHHLRDLSAFPDIDGDPSVDFNETWVEAWKNTNSFKIWDKNTENHLFDIVEPRHPTAGGLSIDDINRRLTQQIQDLHLDERLATSKEALNKHLASGHKKVSTAFNNLWADIETLREAQRRRTQDARALQSPQSANNPLSPLDASTLSPSTPGSEAGLLPSPSRFAYGSPGGTPATPGKGFDTAALRARAPDLTHAQAVVGAAGQKAGAYISSWGAWAAERRKGWGKSKSEDSSGNGGGGGRGAGGGGGGDGSAGDGGDGKGTEEKEGESARDTVSPLVKSPKRGIGPRRKSSREVIGGDGIGRLDA